MGRQDPKSKLEPNAGAWSWCIVDAYRDAGPSPPPRLMGQGTSQDKSDGVKLKSRQPLVAHWALCCSCAMRFLPNLGFG